MSKENVTGFFASLTDGGEAGLSNDPTPVEVIGQAQQRGFEFSEGELLSVMKEMIWTAQSLPMGWGWKFARNHGLVRKTS
ncbi:MAG: hypothetical protein HQ512_13690 [Rhodospirillales bacterium]|nr:hypothetical protein [Rhodospirillales bacterium]